MILLGFKNKVPFSQLFGISTKSFFSVIYLKNYEIYEGNEIERKN